MTATEERSVRVAKGGIRDFHEALAWAVQAYDKEFTTATMVGLEIQQTYVLGDRETPDHYQWSAVVHGLVEERRTG